MTPTTNEKTIFPTGTCFDDCIDYLNHLALENPANIKKLNEDYRVCHGICLMDSGEPFAHAWLEYRNSVIDGGIYQGEKVAVRIAKHEFYANLKPLKVIRYTLKMCCHLEKRVFKYQGPWDPEIRALCKDTKGHLRLVGK